MILFSWERSKLHVILRLYAKAVLPALAEADDDFNYVLKFKGAGHGIKALIAELLGGEIARVLGLQIPELVLQILTKLSEEPKLMKKFKICCKEAKEKFGTSFSFRSY